MAKHRLPELIENTGEICEYGCGQDAHYHLLNGKWCCSPHRNSCLGMKSKNRVSNIGKILTEETKIKISLASKGRPSWIKGKTHSEETKQKIRLTNTGRVHSQETKDKISVSHIGKTHTKEAKKKMSESSKGQIAWNKGIPHTYETRKKISNSNKGKSSWHKGIPWDIEVKQKIQKAKQLTISKVKEKYPTFYKIEEMRYDPNNPGKNEIQFHCKNSICENSLEKGGWFTPTYNNFMDRVRCVESESTIYGSSHFYCSENCKQTCSIFNKSASQLIKQDQINAGIIDESYYTSAEYQSYRKEVLQRADNKCEYCGKPAVHVHHSRPQKLEPFFSLDPDFGVACCKECHYKYGHRDECSTGVLSHTICR